MSREELLVRGIAGKVALITGGGRGIGRGTAIGLPRRVLLALS